MQSVGFQFSSQALLHQRGKEDSPNGPLCRGRESLGQIQSRCKVLGRPQIVTHHMIWCEILLQLLSHSGDERDENKWTIPSAISEEQHKELMVLQILHSQGLFPSDEALESNILEFFAQRTALALLYASHFTDDTDPAFFALEPDSQADLLARLRSSTYTLTENKIRPLTDQELQTTAAFLDLRPDGYAKSVNDWQSLSSLGPWTPRRQKRKMLKGAGMHLFWNSSTPCRRGLDP